MGYFSNGTEGTIYQERYCYQCAHWNRNYGCPCLSAHELWNYEECNKPDSLLHKMIPRDGIENGECMFFVHADPQQTGDTRAELEKLLRKVAADGCPREGVFDCKITRNYGGAECVACWKRWAGIDPATKGSEEGRKGEGPEAHTSAPDSVPTVVGSLNQEDGK